MSDLKDCEIERLSHLLATGNMKHATEIARLLGQKKEQRQKPDPLVALLESFLSNNQLRTP
ncbi:MAG TPA: hypothetical protein VFE01_05020 [Terracidiphilus sp.]|nr:hypothetical protein [Terracidiphilus sp.]